MAKGATGIFTVGFSVREVLQIQQKAKQLLMDGKTVMSYSDSGTQVAKDFAMPIPDVLKECKYALQQLDPQQYGRRQTIRVSNYGLFRHY